LIDLRDKDVAMLFRADEGAENGTFFNGLDGAGKLMWSLTSMCKMLDMVGRTSGSSCTQRRPTWKQRHASLAEYDRPKAGSMKSVALSSTHKVHACRKGSSVHKMKHFDRKNQVYNGVKRLYILDEGLMVLLEVDYAIPLPA
jgi:hypothetical protein